jgi:hypothetical protein
MRRWHATRLNRCDQSPESRHPSENAAIRARILSENEIVTVYFCPKGQKKTVRAILVWRD